MRLTVPVDKLDPYVHGFHPGNDLAGKIKKATYLVHYNQVSVPGQKSKAKGNGVENIHVFIYITEASVKTVPDISTFVYDGMVKRGKYVRQFDISQEGKRVWYIVRIMFKGKDQRYSSPSEPWDGIIM